MSFAWEVKEKGIPLMWLAIAATWVAIVAKWAWKCRMPRCRAVAAMTAARSIRSNGFAMACRSQKSAHSSIDWREGRNSSGNARSVFHWVSGLPFRTYSEVSLSCDRRPWKRPSAGCIRLKTETSAPCSS